MGLVYNGSQYTLTCDHCGQVLMFQHHNANVMRDIAHNSKWYYLRGTQKDYCPSCKDEYESQKTTATLK